MVANPVPTIDLIKHIRPAVERYARRTPLVRSAWLSRVTKSDVFLKCENLQLTGSFKVRGALAALAMLPEAKRSSGVVACSAGNHGQGLAFAARVFRVPCTIVVPNSVPSVKEEGIKALGAQVIKAPREDYDGTQIWTMERLADLRGTFISPFEHPEVIAGNGGTTMLEITEDGPPMDVVLVPCGGGGCCAGMGITARAASRDTRIVAVNTDASPGMVNSRRDERPYLTLRGRPTIADGIEGGIGKLPFELGKRYIDDAVLARETTIRTVVPDLARHERMIVEPSGAAGVAALLDGQVTAKRVCCVLTGGNIDWELFMSLAL